MPVTFADDDRCPVTITYGGVTIRCDRPYHADGRHWTDELNWPCAASAA